MSPGVEIVEGRRARLLRLKHEIADLELKRAKLDLRIVCMGVALTDLGVLPGAEGEK